MLGERQDGITKMDRPGSGVLGYDGGGPLDGEIIRLLMLRGEPGAISGISNIQWLDWGVPGIQWRDAKIESCAEGVVESNAGR